MTAMTHLRRATLAPLAVCACVLAATPVLAQNYPITAGQRATAHHVAERGIAESELAPNAPDTYVVKPGDTLWAISGMYLLRPWRWPELWGMNLQTVRNPHLIYPGQTLHLHRDGGYARLLASPAQDTPTVKMSPRVRTESLAHAALPTLKPHLIEPFLVTPLVVDAQALTRAPRIVASSEQHVLMSRGDRAYAIGDASAPLRAEPGEPSHFHVFRDAVALKDPQTGEILGYEAQFLGKAELVRGEGVEETFDGKGERSTDRVPATVDLTATKEEIRPGDRLLPAPGRAYVSYTPHAPQAPVDARVVSVYGGSAVSFAAQNQVIAINRGTQDGMEPGLVLSLLTKGERVRDTTAPVKDMVKLPSERNGLAMVFRTFDRVSYALILEIRTGVRVGDRLTNPQ